MDRQILVPKSIKKYSIDLSIFSASDSPSESDSDMSDRSARKNRKMTYDFSYIPTRARNPIQKDPMFQKMNQLGSIPDIDFDNLL